MPMYNSSFSQGKFPDGFKMAKIIPCKRKMINNYFPINYCPISVLPAFSSILRIIAYKRIIDFLDKKMTFYTNFSLQRTLKFSCSISCFWHYFTRHILPRNFYNYGIRGIVSHVSWRCLVFVHAYLTCIYVYAVADPRGGGVRGVRTPPEIPWKKFLPMQK